MGPSSYEVKTSQKTYKDDRVTDVITKPKVKRPNHPLLAIFSSLFLIILVSFIKLI